MMSESIIAVIQSDYGLSHDSEISGIFSQSCWSLALTFTGFTSGTRALSGINSSGVGEVVVLVCSCVCVCEWCVCHSLSVGEKCWVKICQLVTN